MFISKEHKEKLIIQKRKMEVLLFGEEKIAKKIFFNKHGYELNLDQPNTFSEKIQWIKFKTNLEDLSPLVDKYEVRSYVAKKIGLEYLIPLIGVYRNSNEIDFGTMPEKFVIKATHGSSWNYIVDNKKGLNEQEALKKINHWLSVSFYDLTGERNYKPIPARVVIEEFIQDSSGDLKDYKFFCFNGKAMMIQVDGDRYTQHKRDLYDTSWNKIGVKYEYDNFEGICEKPQNLDLMIELAETLAGGFNFVRVDLYNVDGRIYFGELTFTPGNGLDRFEPVEFDYIFGTYWNLPGNNVDINS